ncbi:MAG: MGDG synthase family glycosyltransferase [Acidimicrobiales bacterium]
MGGRVFVVSASMGAGHDGAARELARRLEARGHTTEVVDFLDSAPFGIGTLVRVCYELQLRLAPWAYEATYRLWYLLPILVHPCVSFVTFLTRRRLLRWIRVFEADVVVTTYPLASLTLGRARRQGRLQMPVVTFVTDFAVHPLWVHPGTDLNLCVHPASAEAAARRTGRTSTSPGPLVPARFDSATRPAWRAQARARLGAKPDDRLVLVVAGSWGVGEVEKTFDSLLQSDRYTPVVVCGRNERLRERLEQRGAGIVIGWTDEMPSLMAASDVLVQNAGGLTCMEAFAAGLPVVSYRPIPGHGRENAIEMDCAGVALFASRAGDLEEALAEATGLTGRRTATAGRAMFTGDAAADVDQLVAVAQGELAARRAARGAQRAGRSARGRVRARHAGLRRAGIAVAAVGATAYAGVTVGVGTAAAHGIGVAHGPRHSGAVFVGVRVSPEAIADPTVVAALARAHVSAVLGVGPLRRNPTAVQHLAAAGVDVANGGWGLRDNRSWTRAQSDVLRASQTMRHTAGVPCHEFVPRRRVDGFDLASARLAHERVVVPRHGLPSGQLPDRLSEGQVYVIDLDSVGSSQILQALARLDQELTQGHLRADSLAALR